MGRVVLAGTFEIIGILVLVTAGVQAVVALTSSVRRYVTFARRSESQNELFRKRTDIELEVARVEREQSDLTWNGPRKFEIAKRVYENLNEDVCSFYLKPHDRKEIPPFRPGQFLTFHLNIPGQSKTITRCYSLSDCPEQRDYYRISVRRQGLPPNAPEGTPPGLSSNFFHDHIQEGDIVDVLAPAGEFYLNKEFDRPVVLISGGVGLTPSVSMLNHIVESGSNREVWFFYGVRHRDEHAMHEHLSRLAEENANINLIVCYSEPTDICVLGRDYTHKGWVNVKLMKDLLPANNYEFYICGPPPMMEMITDDLKAWGVPEADINFEAFGPATVKKISNADESSEVSVEFEVVFSRSNKKATWSEKKGAILELGESLGLSLESGCRSGSCGTCLVAIKEGDIEYLHRPSRPTEVGSCLICVSRPKSRIVLDA